LHNSAYLWQATGTCRGCSKYLLKLQHLPAVIAAGTFFLVQVHADQVPAAITAGTC